MAGLTPKKVLPYILALILILGVFGACMAPSPRIARLFPTPDAAESLPAGGTAGVSPTRQEEISGETPAAATPALAPSSTPTPHPTPAETVPPTPTQELRSRFAVIGDYGEAGQAAADVANLVKSWAPEFILTVGDNNYPSGSAETIDQNIGQYYHDYIFPYHGAYGLGGDQNRFFPTLGNHDWLSDAAQPYFDYFTLPGNERYYDFQWGPVHFFALDSDGREPDGVGSSSAQAAWLQAGLAASTSPWKIVYMHHPGYASGENGPVDWMRWPFAAWGASAVLAGHNHVYERLQVDGIPLFINGIGGGAIYNFADPVPESQARFNDDYGAMLVEAGEHAMTFRFFTRSGALVDEFTLNRP